MELSPRLRFKLDRLKQQWNGIFGTEEEKPRPRLCPSCGTLVGATASKCAQCGANVNFGIAAASRSLSRLLPAESPVTYLILTVTCIFYAVTFAITVRYNGFQAPGGGGFSGLMGLGGISGGVLQVFGASLPWPMDLQAFPWRLIMPTLLHGGLLHIGFNMWVLMDVGPQIEELYGSGRYLFIYFFTGVGAYLVSGFFGRHMSIGASGSLLGLIGVMLAITTKREGEHIRALRNQLIKWVVYIAIMGFMMSGIDNWAHGGGLVTGFLVGKIMVDRLPMTPSENLRANLLGWVTGLLVLGCIVFTVIVVHAAMRVAG
ncbi:MAG: rhomboid family intramembrane serine protease [Candidatus Acidiferrales bacterium]